MALSQPIVHIRVASYNRIFKQRNHAEDLQAYRIVGLADETKTGQGRSDGEDLQTLREQPQPWWARHAEVPQKM